MKKTWLAISLCAALAVTATTGCSLKSIANLGKTETKEEDDSENVYIEDAASYITLAEYTKISLKKSDIDEELQENIDEQLSTYASYKKIKKGKVKSGDTVNIYYVGKVNGEAFDNGSCTKDTNPEGYDLTIGSNTFIDGFEDGLIGKKIGKTYDIKVTFPEDYSQSTELAGKKATFTVTINSKQGKKKKQKFNDAFVKKNLTGYTSAEDYKTQTRASLVQSEAVSKVCEDTKINEYPEDELEATKKQLTTSIEAYLTQQGVTLEDYLENLNTTEDEYNEQIDETAKEDLGNELIYNAIAQAENLEITDDEYQTELETYLTNYSCETESDLNSTFEETYGASAKKIIYSNLLYQKVAEYLAGNVVES